MVYPCVKARECNHVFAFRDSKILAAAMSDFCKSLAVLGSGMKEIEISRRRSHRVSPSQQRVPVRASMGGNTEQFFGAAAAAAAAEKFLVVVVRKGGRKQQTAAECVLYISQRACKNCKWAIVRRPICYPAKKWHKIWTEIASMYSDELPLRTALNNSDGVVHLHGKNRPKDLSSLHNRPHYAVVEKISIWPHQQCLYRVSFIGVG